MSDQKAKEFIVRALAATVHPADKSVTIGYLAMAIALLSKDTEATERALSLATQEAPLVCGTCGAHAAWDALANAHYPIRHAVDCPDYKAPRAIANTGGRG